MNIIGLDPGFAAFGFVSATIDEGRVVFLDGHTLFTKPAKAGSKATDLIVRASSLAGRLLHLTQFPVDVVCLEGMSHPRNASSATKLGAAHGVIASLLVTEWFPEHTFIRSPQAVRKTVTGHKMPSEQETHDYLRAHYPELSDIVKDYRKASLPHIFDAAAVVVAANNEGVFNDWTGATK